MLPENFKFHIVNNTGVTIEFNTDNANNTFTIKSKGWKHDSNGAVDYDATENTWFADPTADLTDGSSVEAASAVDNGTDKWQGAHCHAVLETDAAVAGTIDIYYEWSTDGGTTYPSDSADFNPEEDLVPVGSIICTSTAEDRSINFEI